MEALIEQRKEARTNISWPVSIWLPQANRFFNGRSANISRSGVLIKVPMTMPARPGHLVEINFPRTPALAKQKGQFARVRTGKVVRVDRTKVLTDAEIAVAVAFN